MRVLGIDPGSETLGWGVVEGSGLKYSPVDFGTVKSSPKESFSKRLLKIYDGIEAVIRKFQPEFESNSTNRPNNKRRPVGNSKPN